MDAERREGALRGDRGLQEERHATRNHGDGRLEEIRNKIKSVQSTRKITKAMEMVAASKMKKAQERMRASRAATSSRMLAIARHLAHARARSTAIPFSSAAAQPKNVGLIVVTIGQGSLRRAQHQRLAHSRSPKIKAWQAKGVGVQVTAIGNKGLGFMNRLEGQRRRRMSSMSATGRASTS